MTVFHPQGLLPGGNVSQSHYVRMIPTLCVASRIRHPCGIARHHYPYGVGIVRYFSTGIHRSVDRINLDFAVMLIYKVTRL